MARGKGGKRRRRRGPGAASGAAAPPHAPAGVDTRRGSPRGADRRARKELARTERDRWARRERRRRAGLKVAKWGAAAAAVAGVAGFIYLRGAEDRRIQAKATELAGRLGCTEIQELDDEGRQHMQAGEPPPAYGSTPGASGRHSGSPLPSEPHVYEDPVPEEQAIHNLEHGYVRIHYQAEGDDALPAEVVESLEGFAEDEDKIIMAPYPELEPGTSLALVGWARLQTCPALTDVDQAVTLAKAFLGPGRSVAPEPAAP